MTTPSIEERLGRLGGTHEQINLRPGRLEEEMSALRSEIISLRSEVSALGFELRSEMSAMRSELNARIDRTFFYMMALMGGIMASVIATILTRLL